MWARNLLTYSILVCGMSWGTTVSADPTCGGLEGRLDDLLRCRPIQKDVSGIPLTLPTGSVSVETALALFSPDEATALSWLATIGYGGLEYLELEGNLGFVLVTGKDPEGRSGTQARISNAFLGVHTESSIDEFSYRFGIGLSFPFADLPQSGLGDTDRDRNRYLAARGYDLAAASRGHWNEWLWLPNRFTVVFPKVRGEYALSDRLALGIDAAFGVSFWTGAGSNSPAGNVQAALEFRYYFSELWQFGMRLQGIASFNRDDGRDFFQSSIDPYTRVNFGNMFLIGRLTADVDTPNGRDGVWGVRVAVGWLFDSDDDAPN